MVNVPECDRRHAAQQLQMKLASLANSGTYAGMLFMCIVFVR
uniref:Uncharacterized protein n=1 Tax=Anguilla anguilla TaxID=7936 RepID=A0A0E9UR27_ANGAN